METKAYLEAYYQNYDEQGRLLSKHGQVEYITTMHYIEKYLRPGMRIMEIGAATGRYSHALAQKGYAVDAVELLDCNIEIFREKTQPQEKVTITQGNALDLSAFADESCDLTLLLGPMYHLFAREDQLRALSEAVRVTKKGGVVFAAYCMSDASILTYGFLDNHIQDLLEKKMVDRKTFAAVSRPQDVFELYRKEDIDALREQLPVTQLHFVASDGYTLHCHEAVDNMQETTYNLYLQYHLATCERQDMVGLSHHTLDIFRKDGEIC